MKTIFSKNTGMSLVEVMIALGVASVASLTVVSLIELSTKQQIQANTASQILLVKQSIIGVINGSLSWQQTIANSANSTANGPVLDCLANSTPCTTDAHDYPNGTNAITNRPIKQLFLPVNGGVISPAFTINGAPYDFSLANSGFTSAGQPCSTYSVNGNDSCPFKFTLTWTAYCSPTSCINPQPLINLTASYSPLSNLFRISFNPANYSSSFFQGAGSAVCTWVMNGTNLVENCAPQVGIGTTSPLATLDVYGTIKARMVTNGGASIDFSTGNIQSTSASCGAITLKNMQSGSTYTLAVTGAAGGTCVFSPFSDGGSTALTLKKGTIGMTQTAAKQTLFTFLVVGSSVFVASIDGY